MLDRAFRRPAEERSLKVVTAGAYGGYTYGYTPVPVSTATALGHAASSACIDVLAGSASTLPFDAVRNIGKVRRPVEPPPPLVAKPSALVENDVWLYQLVESMLTDGNGFGLVVATDALSRPTQIELVGPDCVTDRRVEGGVAQARVDQANHKLYPFGDLWHVPGKFVRAGSPFADSPIARAASTIGTAIAARDYAARIYEDGGTATNVVYSDQELTADQSAGIKARIVDALRGSRQPLVLGSGLRYEPQQANVVDAALIPVMQFAIEEACRFWRVPPSMVYAAVSGQNVTYANVSQADLHYLKHSLEWLLRRIEIAVSRLLTRPVVFRFNRNAFLRSDPETRHGIYSTRLSSKTISVNEIRTLEDEEPFGPEFDEPGVPGNTPAPPEASDEDPD